MNIENVDKSVEAIHFQVNSSFPKELEAIFQQAFDFCNRYDLQTDNSGIHKFERLAFLFSESLNELLYKTILKHTGLSIDKFEITVPTDFESALEFYMLHQFRYGADKIYHNIQAYRKYNSATSVLDEIVQFSKSLDKNTGIVDKNTNLIVLTLGIPVGMFSLKDFIKDGDKYQYDVKEIVAILLHEIGHMISFVEYSKNNIYSGYYGNNLLSDLTENVKQNPKKAITDTINIISNNDVDTKYNNIVKTINKILINIRDEYDDNKINNSKYKYFITHVLVMMIVLIIDIILLVVMIPYNLILSPNEIKQSLDDFDKHKSRDIITSKNESMLERLADEYVSRFQYGKYLISRATKWINMIKYLHNYPGFKPIFVDSIRDNRSLILVTQVMTIPSKIMNYLKFIKTDGISSEYETQLLRLRRIINNTHDSLKATNLPENIRASIVNDIDEMEDQLLSISKDLNLNAIEKALKFIMNVIPSVGGFAIDIFAKNNPYKEYEHLFEYLDNMLSNKSFYYASKIKILMKK